MRLITIAALLALAACTETAPPSPASAGEAATVAASANETAGNAPATLRGRVMYPSEELPAMRVCALAAADPGSAHCVATEVHQMHFELVLPAGEWWLLAWPLDTGTAGDPGLLSAASQCLADGGTGCDDHALQTLQLAAGELRDGLDINDWYYDPADFPPPMAPAAD
ncbi:hypothetical protein [Arenimonas sp.]|uniref:hypothetical protein n=1 Tax=Arenimonas sp. TaxID=1872635 RepID=UPI002E37B994|nr:hypothetical protein [Arenimonas sp.]HEX4854302.1 hypothetical protein [Arenimonas sp.]